MKGGRQAGAHEHANAAAHTTSQPASLPCWLAGNLQPTFFFFLGLSSAASRRCLAGESPSTAAAACSGGELVEQSLVQLDCLRPEQQVSRSSCGLPFCEACAASEQYPPPARHAVRLLCNVRDVWEIPAPACCNAARAAHVLSFAWICGGASTSGRSSTCPSMPPAQACRGASRSSGASRHQNNAVVPGKLCACIHGQQEPAAAACGAPMQSDGGQRQRRRRRR